MLYDDSLKNYIMEVASGTPAPGGGSVAAAVASLGMSLTSMVYNLTIGRKFYNEYDSDIKDELENGLKISKRLVNQFIELIEEDKDAYEKVIEAIKMPKDTDKAKALRAEALNEAYLYALNVPLKLARACGEGFAPTLLIAQYGNQNAISDSSIGANLLFSALESSIINVKVNIPYIKDEKLVKDALSECDELLKRYKPIRDEILRITLKEL